jgi:hypothetical protein
MTSSLVRGNKRLACPQLTHPCFHTAHTPPSFNLLAKHVYLLIISKPRLLMIPVTF